MNEDYAPNVRYAEVAYGDDLRAIALRELGDASYWLDLIVLNGLRPPYIAASASSGVLAYGDQIAIPSPSSLVSADTDPAYVYGADLLVQNRRLVVDGGDLMLVSGVANLTQALSHHIITEKQELAFHPEFGCWVRSMIGNGNSPSSSQLAAFYVKSALLEDERVDTVPYCSAVVLGDQIKVNATVVPITGKPLDLQLVV